MGLFYLLENVAFDTSLTLSAAPSPSVQGHCKVTLVTSARLGPHSTPGQSLTQKKLVTRANDYCLFCAEGFVSFYLT